MNVFFEEFAVDSLRRAFVVARVISVGLFYIKSSDVVKLIDGAEVPAVGAPPDLTRHVKLAQ